MTEAIPKIPFATISRFIGKPYGAISSLSKNDIAVMVGQGVVAPDPSAKDYGPSTVVIDGAQNNVDSHNADLDAMGSPYRLRLQVTEKKSKPLPKKK